ncbi:hypothetical protein L6164_012295 [Bauhinia variegata]|uniref:Uncharacterized protein n=1 Tax=Bauhinia variegata TaxID=167791 RepID=A0ACB9PES4_BAUVA|nr:hypothetical protein L6164_012295 [Bauhinia variegata]
MEKPLSSRRTQIDSEVTESEMAAAHQLIQLSDEDNKKIRSRSSHEDEEVDNQSLSIITSAKIEEIFGKDELFRPKKQRRYRSLVDLYMETRPINAGNGKKVKPLQKKPKWVYRTNQSAKDS